LNLVKTLGDVLERNARLYPNKNAVLFEDYQITHSDYFTRIKQLAAGLANLGLKKQDRFSVLAMNCPEYLELYSAAQWAGTIINTVNFRLAGAEIAWIVQNAGPRVLVFQQQYSETIAALRHDLASIETFICIGSETPEWAISYESLFQQDVDPDRFERGTEDDFAALVYTSGTTGKPKGVIHTNRSLFTVSEIISSECGLNGDTKLLAAAPLFHAGASTLCWSANFRGGCTLLLREFKPDNVIQSIAEHRVTAMHMVPAMVQAVMDSPIFSEHDLSSLKMLMYAAAPMPLPVLKRAVAAFGPITYNGYGQTEINMMTFLHPHQHVLEGDSKQVGRLASVGQPHWQCQIRIVSENGQPCASGEVGEIVARSPTSMFGYWNNSSATIETLREGWIHTGDLGYLDKEGYLFLVDRKKDMIISGGENIYSREVEESIAQHPDVNEVAVIGKPDEKWGETVVAIVALKPNSTVSAEQLISFSKSNIASYKCPKQIEFIDQLPRLNTGKVNKVELRKRFADTQ